MTTTAPKLKKQWEVKHFALRKNLDFGRCQNYKISIHSNGVDDFALVDDGFNFNMRVTVNHARESAKKLLQIGYKWVEA